MWNGGIKTLCLIGFKVDDINEKLGDAFYMVK